MTRSSSMTRATRLLAALAVATVTGLTCLGCLPGTGGQTDRADSSDQTEQKQSGPVEVEFWTINLKKNYGDYIQGLIDGFEKENPDVMVTWVDVPGPDVESKFLAALAGGDVPDAVNVEDLRVDQFAESLSDLTPYFDENELAPYLGGLVDSVRRDDKLLAIPWYNGGAPVTWFNSDLLEQAGLDPAKLPTTWEEALDAGGQIADRTDACAFNALPTLDVLLSNGAEPLTGTGDDLSPGLDTPENAKVLDRFRDAYRDGTICKGAVSEQIRNLPQTVTNKLAAGAVDSLPFILLDIEKNAPEVYRNLEVGHAVTGSTGKFVIPGMQTFVIPDKSDVKEQAAELIEYVTSPAAQLEFCKLVTIFPSTQETLDDPFFTDIDVKTPAEAARKAVVEELPDTVTKDLGTKVDLELDEAYLKEIRAFMTGDQPATEALAAVEDEWAQLLAGK
jgi:putative chitobiose transport system substrate-binding protein